jgi:hypothetical protein
MKIEKANRQQTPIKLALQGPSGSGKTYSSLLLAYGLVGNWEQIAVVDTENSSTRDSNPISYGLFVIPTQRRFMERFRY